MKGLIFDDATCELVPAFIAIPPRRQLDYIRVAHLALPESAEPLPQTVKAIREAVTDHYGLGPFDMVSARRSRAIARPRQLAMFLARKLTIRSTPEIGRAFGGRDHSTVIHACRTIESLLKIDAELRADHDAILEALGE